MEDLFLKGLFKPLIGKSVYLSTDNKSLSWTITNECNLLKVIEVIEFSAGRDYDDSWIDFWLTFTDGTSITYEFDFLEIL